MENRYGEFIISDDKEKLKFQRIKEMLSATYWAQNRTEEVISKTIDHSICFGIYKNELQIGFARCVTDYAIMYWVGDVVIDNNYRGLGLGKALIEAITKHDDLKTLRGILETRDAHGLYSQYGFIRDGEKYMCRRILDN